MFSFKFYKWLSSISVLFLQNGLRTNMRGVVRIRFNNRPEYLRVGSRLLFREGKTKGMGEITKVFPYYGDKDLPSR